MQLYLDGNKNNFLQSLMLKIPVHQKSKMKICYQGTAF